MWHMMDWTNKLYIQNNNNTVHFVYLDAAYGASPQMYQLLIKLHTSLHHTH